MTNEEQAAIALECAAVSDFAPLVYRLRSGDPMTKEERNFLADYLLGKRGKRGRPAKRQRQQELRRDYRLYWWLTEYEQYKPYIAEEEVACRHGVSVTTVRERLEAARQRGIDKDIDAEEVGWTAMLMQAAKDNPDIVKFLRIRMNTILSGRYFEPPTVKGAFSV